jgi:hypothetical protein
MKAVLAGAALAVSIATPAFADYYIVRETASNKCMVVSDRPIDTSQVLIGGSYETMAEALRALSKVCDQKG